MSSIAKISAACRFSGAKVIASQNVVTADFGMGCVSTFVINQDGSIFEDGGESYDEMTHSTIEDCVEQVSA